MSTSSAFGSSSLIYIYIDRYGLHTTEHKLLATMRNLMLPNKNMFPNVSDPSIDSA